MDSAWNLEPWILDAVLSEIAKRLSANLPLPKTTNITEVDCTKKRLIQILNFGRQKKPPFTRLSISDSSTRIVAKLSEGARKEIKRGTERSPPSRTEGAVCELTQYSLIFDPSTADGVIVDIRTLLYKGGACMSAIGEPKPLTEQVGAADMVRAMRSLPVSHEEDEPMSSQVLSQADLLSDDGDDSSVRTDIATQVPRKTTAHKQSHRTGDGVVGKGDLLGELREYNERKSTGKRRTSSSRVSFTSERSSKRQHIEETQKRAPSPPIISSFEQSHPSSKDEIASAVTSVQTTALLVTTAGGLRPAFQPKLAQEVAIVQSMKRRQSGDDPHNKAVPDTFQIGSNSVSRKLVTPPKLQSQYLSIDARYVDPRLPTEELPVGIPPSVILDLSTLHSAQHPSTTLRSNAREARISQAGDVDGADAESGTKTTMIASESELCCSSLPMRSERYVESEALEKSDVESSDAGSCKSWSPSAHGSPIHNPAALEMNQARSEHEVVQSGDEYPGSPPESPPGEDDEPQDSPVRLPSIIPGSPVNVHLANSSMHHPSITAQEPYSSLSIECELEQEVPVALHSPEERTTMKSGSPTPVPKAIRLAALRSPVLQIERSPSQRGLGKRVERSLFLSTLTGDSAEAARADAPTISSDPIIPATCADSQETSASISASQDEALQSIYLFDPVRAQRDTVLVPATIPTRAVPASPPSHVVNSNDHETHIVAGRVGAVRSQLGPEVGESSPIQKRPRKVQLVAPDYSQLNSSIDIQEMARANRRSFLAQPEGPEGQLLKDKTASPTYSSPEGIDRKVAGELKTTSIGPSATHVAASSEPTDPLLQSVEKNGAADLSHAKDSQILAGHCVDAPDSTPPLGATIFDTFKLKYPQFQHELGRFVMACTYIEWLRDNRRLMPLHPSLWDDFIRIFCGPYRDYLLAQKNEATPRESPVEFYNREVMTSVFTGTIVTQKTLPLALAIDPGLTAKYTERLRRISSRVAARSEKTTPQERRTVDIHKSSDSSRGPGAAPPADAQARDEPHPHRSQPRSPVRSGPLREESLQDEGTSIAKEWQSCLQEAQGIERKNSEAATSSTYITPKNSAKGVFTNLTREDGTPTKIGCDIEAVERDVLAAWVQRSERKKARRRTSLLAPEFLT